MTRKPHDRIRVIPLSSQPYLFVYGTLKSNFSNRYARQLRREAKFIGPARMRGRLYRIRRYPGMRPPRDSADLVTGELYRLRQPARTLAVLDAWEANYRRELRRARLDSGRAFQAWVYVYRVPLGQSRRVATGEWAS
jgi:gamma-glutamylcyclotransferase (GGCT)/AIG2-like uncharacterized protein YtfP